MKKYRAYIKLNNDIPTEIKVELKEVTFDGIDYIEKENNHGFK